MDKAIRKMLNTLKKISKGQNVTVPKESTGASKKNSKRF